MSHKNILFISSSESLQSYAYLYLNKSEQDCQIDFAASVSLAIESLQSSKSYDVIYLGHIIKLDKSLKELSAALLPIINANKSLIAGTNKALKGKAWASYFHEYMVPDKVMLKLYQLLSLEEGESKYLSFSLLNLLRLENFPFDFYLKIEGQERFLKIFKKKDEILFEEVHKYIDKKVCYVYALRADIDARIELFTQKVEAAHEAAAQESPGEIYENSMEFVSQDLEELGINVSDQNKIFTKESFGHTKELVEKTIKDKKYLTDLLSKSNTFYYKHIAMTSFVSCYVLDELYMSDVVYKQKLCLAANLHNLFLNTEEELMVDSSEQLGHFTQERQDVLVEHGRLCSDFFATNDKIDSDVLKIIREHHGDKQGKAFATKMSSASKLSLIFQMSALFSQKYLIASKRNDYGQVEVMNLFLKVQERLETRDKSLLKALREVAFNLN